MTIANQLTLLRIGMVPILVVLLVYGRYGWALIIFGVAGLTDALDGILARLRHERTELGTMLDPLADKLLVTSSLIVLALPDSNLAVRIPPWIAILSIGRDAAILLAVLVFNLAVGRRTFLPTILGKATTLVHLLMILWILWRNYLGETHVLTPYLLGLTAGLVVASGLHYLYIGRKILTSETPNES